MYPICESPSHRAIFISYCLHCDTAEMIRAQKSINPACTALPSTPLRHHASQQSGGRKFTGLFGGVDGTLSKVGKVHNRVHVRVNISEMEFRLLLHEGSIMADSCKHTFTKLRLGCQRDALL